VYAYREDWPTLSSTDARASTDQERRDTSMIPTRTAERQLKNTLFCVEVGSKKND
jgi:hypothetical protein